MCMLCCVSGFIFNDFLCYVLYISVKYSGLLIRDAKPGSKATGLMDGGKFSKSVVVHFSMSLAPVISI